jgi:hypothetical protein
MTFSVQSASNLMLRMKLRTIEEYCRSVGIDESNAHEVQIHSYPSGEEVIVRNGVQIAQIVSSVKQDEDGLRFKVTCYKAESP